MRIDTLPRTLAERHKQPPNGGAFMRLRGKPDPVKIEIIEHENGKSRVDLSSTSEASLKIEADKFKKTFAHVIFGEPYEFRDDLFYPHIVFCITKPLEA